MQIHYLTLDNVHIGNFIVLKHFFSLFFYDFLNKHDNNSNIQLIILDLSAEFDTIDHSIFIKRLEDFGIVGIPLAWIKSYLSERTFSIKIDNH